MDELKALYDAREVISVLIDTDTFHIKAFASFNRYNPNDIKEKDISNLSVHAIQYLFRIDEFSGVLDYRKITQLKEIINHTIATYKPQENKIFDDEG